MFFGLLRDKIRVTCSLNSKPKEKRPGRTVAEVDEYDDLKNEVKARDDSRNRKIHVEHVVWHEERRHHEAFMVRVRDRVRVRV